MITIKDKHNCSGCTACFNVCTHHAITMQPDTLGFMYPKVNLDICVDCGLCERVCAFNPNYDISTNFPNPQAFAARHKSESEIMRSRSGAAFIAITDEILKQNGVVYGVGYKEHFQVAHKRATTKEQRDEFRGSKYVQSDLTNIFLQVRDDLKCGKTTLFSGTPCQVAGLKAFLGKLNTDNLILLDIVCSGVPSPKFWSDHLDYLERKHQSPVSYVNFRDKEVFGWKALCETYKYGDSHEKKPSHYVFYQPLFFRPSCHVCPFTNLHRPGDITIADFWGWERADSTFNADDKGCSLVLCNTEKGLSLFNRVKKDLKVLPVPLEKVMQNRLKSPTEEPTQKQSFIQCYEKYGYEKALKKYGIIGWRRKILLYKKRILKYLCVSH